MHAPVALHFQPVFPRKVTRLFPGAVLRFFSRRFPRPVSLFVRLLVALTLPFALPAAAQSGADAFPARPVRFVVPFSAGGLPDTLARVLGQQLSPMWNQQVLVDNRPGSSGILASEHVARSPADGYTVLLADPQHLAINPAIFSKLPYDPVKDFAPVTLAAYGPLILVVHPSLPANSLSELIAYVKSKPGAVNYGSSGTGSIHHLTMESLRSALGLEMVHVPFKGGGQSVPALLAGQVTVMFSALPPVMSHVKSGRARVLAVSTARRSQQAPEVPTVSELAVPGFDFAAQIAFVAPAGTPREVIARLNGDIVKVLKQPEVAQKMISLGIDPVGSTPEELAAVIRADLVKFARAVKLSGTKVE